jgi:hypothetical protein
MLATLSTQGTGATPTPVALPALSAAGRAQLVSRLEAEHPEKLARIHRGRDVLRTKHILESDAGYLVGSSVPGQYYRANTFTCGCPSRLQLEVRCKHMWGITLLQSASISARFRACPRNSRDSAGSPALTGNRCSTARFSDRL